MIRGTAILGVGLVPVALAGAYFWTADAAGSGPGVMPENVDIAAGEALYAENCAACHGANLEGQDGKLYSGIAEGEEEDDQPRLSFHKR